MNNIHMNYNKQTNRNNIHAITVVKERIDIYLDNNEYCKAFTLLLSLSELLNQSDKYKLFEHYQDKIYSNMNANNMIPMDPYFNSR